MTHSHDQGEQQAVTRPAPGIFTTWGSTAQALAFIVVFVSLAALVVVVVGMIALVLWLLRLEISIGPFRITRR